MITTTLSAIRSHKPCEDGWKKLLKHLGKKRADSAQLSLITILESNELDDAVWCLRTVKGHDKEIRLFSIACARRVQHLMTDPHSLRVLDIAERYVHGQATAEELEATLEPAFAVRVVWDADSCAARAARAARAEAWYAARGVVSAARRAVAKAGETAGKETWAAAWSAERDEQTKLFQEFFGVK